MSEESGLAYLLEKYPEFRFDVTDYVRGLRHREFLATRLAQFGQVCRGNLPGISRCEVLHVVKSSLADTIPAYLAYKSASRFEDIPIIDAETFRSNPASFVHIDRAVPLWKRYSSGSTGVPAAVFFSEQYYLERIFLSVQKIALINNLQVRTTGVLSCTFVSGFDWPALFLADPLAESRILARIPVDERCSTSLDRAAALAAALRPQILLMKPVLAEALLHRLQAKKRNHDIRPSLVAIGGSYMTRDLELRLIREFRCSVTNVYACGESNVIAISCPEHRGLHADASSVLVETRCVRPGTESPIIISNVINSAMPVIRLQLTDTVTEIRRSPCVCGSHLPTLCGLSGKRVPCFWIENTAFNPERLVRLIRRYPWCGNVQVVQSGRCIELHLSGKLGTDLRTIPEAVQTELASLIPPPGELRTVIEPPGTHFDVRFVNKGQSPCARC